MFPLQPFFSASEGAFLLAFTALFSIVNPVASSIIFNSINAHRTHAERTRLARYIAFYSTIVLLISLWIGSYVLAFFGISLGALRIAGGLVVALRAWPMLTDPSGPELAKKNEAAPAGGREQDVAFYPLTIPFTTGPGTISVAVAVGAERPADPAALAGFFVGVSFSAIVIAGLILVFYWEADRMMALLGESGARVVTRLIAFLLLAIGVQILAGGVIDVLEPVLRNAVSKG